MAVAVLSLGMLASCTASPPQAGGTTPTVVAGSALPSPMPDGWECLAAAGARIDTVEAGTPFPVALLGHGPRTVVLSNQSDETVCAWRTLAAELVDAGFSVALYDYADDPVRDLAAVVGYVRQHGAQTVELVGASEGAKTSIVVAADASPPVSGVVSLSAELQLQGSDVSPYAARLRTPTLFVTAEQDSFGAAAATRAFYQSAPTKDKKLLVRPGSDHGIAMLDDKTVHDAVLRFLTDHTVTGCSDLPSAQPMWLQTADGGRLEAISAGTGDTAIIFLHESGRTGMCGFAPYAAWLIAHYHVRVVLFNRCGYGNSACAQPNEDIRTQTQPAVAWARADGARTVALIGASSGGMDAMDAAALVPGVSSLVVVSGDVNDTGADDRALAAKVTARTLMAVAPDDPYVSVADVQALYRLVPAHAKKLVVVNDSPGVHGWDLLLTADEHPTPLAVTIAAWLTAP